MKDFKEWWKENDYLYGQPIAYDEMQQCWDSAYKAGMLAAADILKEHATDGGCMETLIREAANVET